MSIFSLSHNYFWTFQIQSSILPVKKKEATEYHYHHQMYEVSATAKIFKYLRECIFHRTQLMAMHSTIMTSNTNGDPPSETCMQLPSSNAEPLSGTSNTEVMEPQKT
jgi:hypothetical protein